MRGETSQGPQNWQEFLDRFAELEEEENQRSENWSDGFVTTTENSDDRGPGRMVWGQMAFDILPKDVEILRKVFAESWVGAILELLLTNPNRSIATSELKEKATESLPPTSLNPLEYGVGILNTKIAPLGYKVLSPSPRRHQLFWVGKKSS